MAPTVGREEGIGISAGYDMTGSAPKGYYDWEPVM
jgi:hypothetical protein